MQEPKDTESRHPSLGEQIGLNHGDALIVVDLQRDYLPGGSCGIPQADQIVAPINAYLAAFASRDVPIFLVRDWHPAEHRSFRQFGGKWPPHCVQGTDGAEWPKDLRVPDSVQVVSKGIDPKSDDFSAFEGTSLLDLLLAKKIVRIFVAGLATDRCVRATVLDACHHGFGVVVLADGIRGINREPGDETRAIREMIESGAVLFERGRGSYANAKTPPPVKRHIYYLGDYGFGVEVTLPFDEAVERVTQALRNEGFGIISDVDVAATVSSKLGVSMPPYRILGACNPTLAHQAVEARPEVGLFLPCNVVVRRDHRGVVFIELMDPAVIGALTADAQIMVVVSQVRRRLRRAIGWI